VPATDRLGDARRILVYGATGSGKSTLADAVAELTGIQVTSVDDICWSPGWAQMPRDEQLETFDRITRGDAWILDSAYEGWRHLAHERADLVVALDFARLTSFSRLLRRTLRRMIDGTEVCNGNRESFREIFLARDSILLWHVTSFRRKRAEMRAWEAAASGPRVIRLRRPAHARVFLRDGRVGPGGGPGLTQTD
jgi:adenylate kinase family enzyme